MNCSISAANQESETREQESEDLGIGSHFAEDRSITSHVLSVYFHYHNLTTIPKQLSPKPKQLSPKNYLLTTIKIYIKFASI